MATEEKEKESKIKRTHTFTREHLERLERLAEKEQRPVSRQLGILLEDALKRAEERERLAA